MQRAVVKVAGSPRLAFVCRMVLASAALDRGDLAMAGTEARAALTVSVVDARCFDVELTYGMSGVALAEHTPLAATRSAPVLRWRR